MAIRESDIDKKLNKWFINDYAHNLLRSVELHKGSLRALNQFKINFQYPISLIAGANGCGKSTLLAIVACGFHYKQSSKTRVIKKKVDYYTFKDFIVQSKQEITPSGIELAYETAQIDSERRYLKKHELKKVVGGKWANYQKRVRKNVEYFGIERVVPHYEKSVSKSYKRNFVGDGRTEIDEKTEASVSKILGKKYTNFELQKHATHSLPQVSRDTFTYSGFNMGAGENALFEIFFTLHACPNASLIVIDEIELGLHSAAQLNFIEELKVLCDKKKLQIIATTHSASALSAVPPYARFFIESNGAKTIIKECISTEFAASKFDGKNSEELVVFVEDEVAKRILSNALNGELRNRVLITAVGSDTQVIRYLALSHKLHPKEKFIAYIDGDKCGNKKEFVDELIKMFENYEASYSEEFYSKCVHFLGGNANPEKWILQEMLSNLDEFSKEFNEEENKSKSLLEEALLQDTHKEIGNLANKLQVEEFDLIARIARIIFRNDSTQKNKIIDSINLHLEP